MKKLTLERVYLPDRTLSSLYDGTTLVSKVLELPWKGNQRSISCIPEGAYHVTKEPPIPKDDPNTTDVDESGGRLYRPYWHFRIHDVTNRSGILIHIGNDVAHSQGCLLVGSRFKDYFTDQPKLEESTVKMKWLTDNLPDEFELEIKQKIL